MAFCVWGVIGKECGVTFLCDGNVLELDSGDKQCELLITTELYTLKCLNWWILCYLNFISIKNQK